jgi:UDP-perosamine 4-acetyltransferase
MKLVVIGAGGHAKVIIEAINAAGTGELVGLVAPKEGASSLLGVSVIGNDEDLARLRREGIEGVVVGLGANALRLKVGDYLASLGYELPPVIHPTAVVSPSATIAAGAVIMARAVVGTVIDRRAVVNTSASVDHDNRIGIAAHVAPGCALAGNVLVGERALIGVGTSVRPGVRIGAGSVIGAGSAVVSDIPDDVVVAGAPAKPLIFERRV